MKDPERPRRLREHLRRDHEVRRHRERRRRRGPKQVGLGVPLVVRLEGTNVELGKEILARSGLEIIPADDLADAARKAVSRRVSLSASRVRPALDHSVGGGSREHLRRQEHAGGGAGHHRRRGLLPLRADARVRHAARGGDHPGAGRHALPADGPDLRHRRDAVRETGANASVVFVPPPFAADAIMEAAEAGVALVVVHHRGHPGPGHGAGEALPRGRAADAPDRPELPRRHHAAPVQDRHHARLHPPAGRIGSCQPLRHAHLRGREAAHRRRPRPDDGRGHRRRPVQRHLFVDAWRVRGRSRHRGA
jgi:hypothetical protein